MGFEELASLRDELAQKAAAEKLAERQEKNKASSVKKAPPVDPVVLIIGQLQKKFPLAFPKKPAPKVPLKIGIHKDILDLAEQMGVNKNDLRTAIKRWCWGNRYWECLVEDAVRVDLYGKPAGCVTKEDAEQAGKLKEGRQRNANSSAERNESQGKLQPKT